MLEKKLGRDEITPRRLPSSHALPCPPFMTQAHTASEGVCSQPGPFLAIPMFWKTVDCREGFGRNISSFARKHYFPGTLRVLSASLSSQSNLQDFCYKWILFF